MDPSLRLMMLGTGDFAVPTFEHLIHQGRHQMIALVTQPDRPQGRKQEIIPSQIKQTAQARGILVLQPEDVNGPESLDVISRLQPDLLVTAAYGQILSPSLLAIPGLGGINLHGSILPAYRGAAPVARAIQNGETETGITVIQMTPRIDAGGIAATAATPIEPDETAGELEERLAWLGGPLVAHVIDALAAGPIVVRRQERSKVTRAPKLRKEDGVIDWSRPARAVHNHVRAMQPWPAASTFWQPRLSESRPPVALDRASDRDLARPRCAGRSHRGVRRPAGCCRRRGSRRDPVATTARKKGVCPRRLHARPSHRSGRCNGNHRALLSRAHPFLARSESRSRSATIPFPAVPCALTSKPGSPAREYRRHADRRTSSRTKNTVEDCRAAGRGGTMRIGGLWRRRS